MATDYESWTRDEVAEWPGDCKSPEPCACPDCIPF